MATKIEATVAGEIRLLEPEKPPVEVDDYALTDDDKQIIKDFRAHDIATLQSLQTNLYSVAAGSLERVKVAAQQVLTAASAITAVYTGVLGLVFGPDAEGLPLRAIVAPLFFGFAIVLSVSYLAYLTNARGSDPTVDESGTPTAKSYARVNFFIAYVGEVVNRRAWMLRAAVVALGLGAAAIALPFVSLGSPTPDPIEKAAIVVHWPDPPSVVDDATTALYSAQVDQAVVDATALAAEKDRVATLEAQTKVHDDWAFFDGGGFLGLVIGLGLLLVVAFPFFTWLAHREDE